MKYEIDLNFCFSEIWIYFTDVPTGPPQISVEKEELVPGEILRANCSYPNSSPAPTLQWFINGNIVSILIF